MDIRSERNGNTLTISLSGELNTVTAPELSSFIDTELTDVATLRLDFAGCDYVSSAGLRLLLATFKKLKKEGGAMRLVNVGEVFMDVLENTGLDAVFDIE